jgi:hypothetical protein
VLLSVLAAAIALASPPVAAGDFLVTNTAGRVRIVDSRGMLVRRLLWSFAGQQIESLELAPDRRHAFVSIWRTDRAPELYVVDLANGRKQKVGDGISPALSPDRKRLAYVKVEIRADSKYLTALVIRNLATGRTKSVALPPSTPLGTPPELVTNWSPDGHDLAIFNGSKIRIVDVDRTLAVPADPRPSVTPPLAPVFLDRKTLVVLARCCIGRLPLITVDVHLRKKSSFATLSSPVEHVRRIGVSRLLVVTGLQELAVVSRGGVHVISRSVMSAAP